MRSLKFKVKSGLFIFAKCQCVMSEIIFRQCFVFLGFRSVHSVCAASPISFSLKLWISGKKINIVPTSMETNGVIEERRSVEKLFVGSSKGPLVASLFLYNVRTCQTPTGCLMGSSPEDVQVVVAPITTAVW